MISVIIPSYNSQSTIEKCLDALYAQTYRGEFEIILADSSVDKTPEIVTTRYPQVQLIHFERKTDPGTARNHGVKESRGEIILFIDSDCEADREWMEKIVSLHREFPEVAAIGGAAINGNPLHDNVGWAGYMGEFREFIPQQPRGFVPHIPTLNISYKRWVFEKLGYFDPRYYPQEDLVFNYQVTQSGYRILFSPDIRVKHTHRSDFRTFLQHQKKIGHITSRVLKVLPLPGASIARNKILFLTVGPLLPAVKLFRTLMVFIQKNPAIVFRHPMAVIVLKIGLVYWFWGFGKGVFAPGMEH